VGEELLRVEGIKKSFGRVEALKGVSFGVKKGEVIGLVGDNGAGKSTLIRILTGVLTPDAGKVYFEGKEVRFKWPSEARAMGIEVVHQGYGVFPDMSIARNFFAGREPTRRFGFVPLLDRRKLNEESKRVIEDIGIGVRSVQEPAGVLSGGERQAINIGRAMYFRAKLLILDEPTTALSVRETEWVLQLIKDISGEGTAVIFVSHNVYHVHRVADRFVVLERGAKIGEFKKEDVTPEEVMKYMVRRKG